ncbi:MAG TPA: metallophosphoesterase family protein [Candidatus Acidoferrum sp.]|nr:metallophosphoesterase family protein [Candidatus Acidoferrum sp.]
MRYAILSDIHGNLEALHAVLAHADSRAEAVLVLGDIVGYGADPQACLERVAERADAVVAGNHEHGVVGMLDLGWFNDRARMALEWTRGQLDDDHLAWLRTRPLTVEIDDATLVHASPDQPAEWDYLLSAEDGFDVFGAFATRLCFVGHSHRPAAWSVGSSGRAHEPGTHEIDLEAGRRYVINVGSVGQPRDRDSRASYALWDLDARRVTIERVPYDRVTAGRKILSADLPRFLADRLMIGA